MTANQLKYQELLESKRHNVTTERETERSNRVMQAETHRTNVVNEDIKQFNAMENFRHNTVTENEAVRHNKSEESIKRKQLQESKRHNVATETISATDVAEKQRHNQVAETISNFQNRETQRSNMVKEYQNATQIHNQSKYWNEQIRTKDQELADKWTVDQQKMELAWQEHELDVIYKRDVIDNQNANSYSNFLGTIGNLFKAGK